MAGAKPVASAADNNKVIIVAVLANVIREKFEAEAEGDDWLMKACKDCMPHVELADVHRIVSDQAGWNQQVSQSLGMWKYSVGQRKKAPSVLVGEVAGGPGGVLRLVQKEAFLDFVVVGNVGMTGCKFGSVVALFDYRIIRETFIRAGQNGTDVQKFYVVVKNSDLLVVKEPQDETSSGEVSKRYRLKILSKSALAFHYNYVKGLSLSHLVGKKVFWGMATYIKLGHKGQMVEKWQRFTKFSGQNTNLYPLLEVGDEYELIIPLSWNPEVVLKKYDAVQQNHGFSERGHLFLPAEIVMRKVSSEGIACGEVSVQGVLTGDGHHHSQLITVSGVVSQKGFNCPLFDSEAHEVPLDICNEHHLGVPGAMNIRLLLQDESHPENKVWLYVTCSTNLLIKGYPLCVIPGVRILVTDVRRMVAKNTKKVYLKSSDFTRIVPLLLPELPPLPDTPFNAVYIPLKNILQCTSTFVTFARVLQVVKASVRVLCKDCDYDRAKDCHICENCLGSLPPVVEVSVEVRVDDGTAIATVLVTCMKHLAVLMGLSRKDFVKLHDVIVSECLHVNYSAHSPQCSQSGRDCELLKEAITRVGFEHSYKFICRRQHSQPHLCLDLTPLRPLNDVEFFLK